EVVRGLVIGVELPARKGSSFKLRFDSLTESPHRCRDCFSQIEAGIFRSRTQCFDFPFERSRQLERDRFAFLFSFENSHCTSPWWIDCDSLSIWTGEDEVLSHHHVKLVAWPDLDRRWPVESLADHLLANCAELSGGRGARRLARHRPLTRLVVTVGSVGCGIAQGRYLTHCLAGTDKAHDCRGSECREIVVIDLIGESCVAALIRARHLRQIHARS